MVMKHLNENKSARRASQQPHLKIHVHHQQCYHGAFVTSSEILQQVTTNLLSRGGKDIAFGDYSPSWKFHRKLVHSAIYLFGDGSASLERMKKLRQCSCSFALSTAAIITNVTCMLCFNSKYEKEDPEFQKMLEYSQGIVNTVGKDTLVDIFPWLQLFPNEDLHLLKRSIAARDSILQKKFEDHK
eukprot:g31714.t1